MSRAEDLLDFQLRTMKLPSPEREHRFHQARRWRFDFAWPDYKLAVEVEGGGWSGGRHTRGNGFAADMEKYDAAMRLGWTVYRCDPAMVKSGHAVETIGMVIGKLKEET